MAYDYQKLIYPGNGLTQNNTTVWQYTTSADTLATVEASGYFDPDLSENTDNLTNLIKTKDFIFISASDGCDVVVVAGVDPITVSAFATLPATLANGDIWIGNVSNLPVANAVTGDVTISNAGLTAIGSGKVLLAMLGSGITPSHVAKFGGKITWSGAGASLATTIAGVAASDLVQATFQNMPTQATTFLQAVPTTNTLTLTMSAANTSNDAVITYTVFRAAS